MGDTVIRPYSESDSLRSDRSASDRSRHRSKVRAAIRENIADIVSEEAIIGRSGDRILKVPIKGIKEYRFVFGDNTPGAATGDGQTAPGDVVGKAGEGRGQDGPGPAGDRPGTDYYETEITVDELVEVMFEDLELPELERRRLREVPAERLRKRKGYRRVGVRVHLDKKRTALARVRRKLARGHGGASAISQEPNANEERRRFPFHRDDIRYRRLVQDEALESNAVVLCLMDTSGSMDVMKKYLARSFFFLLYQFVRTRYQNVEVAFVAHHAQAREVTEQEFFHKGESGGTLISSAYRKALEIVDERYHPSLWNVYAFHCSDGDNWASDNEPALAAARELCQLCNLFGYGEIKPLNSRHYGSSMLDLFRGLTAPNFQAIRIERRADVWPGLRSLLAKERPVPPASRGAA